MSSFKNVEIRKCYDPWQNINLIDTYYKNNDEDKGKNHIQKAFFVYLDELHLERAKTFFYSGVSIHLLISNSHENVSFTDDFIGHVRWDG